MALNSAILFKFRSAARTGSRRIRFRRARAPVVGWRIVASTQDSFGNSVLLHAVGQTILFDESILQRRPTNVLLHDQCTKETAFPRNTMEISKGVYGPPGTCDSLAAAASECTSNPDVMPSDHVFTTLLSCNNSAALGPRGPGGSPGPVVGRESEGVGTGPRSSASKTELRINSSVASSKSADVPNCSRAAPASPSNNCAASAGAEMPRASSSTCESSRSLAAAAS